MTTKPLDLEAIKAHATKTQAKLGPIMMRVMEKTPRTIERPRRPLPSGNIRGPSKEDLRYTAIQIANAARKLAENTHSLVAEVERLRDVVKMTINDLETDGYHRPNETLERAYEVLE
jgi:hypothetical protein